MWRFLGKRPCSSYWIPNDDVITISHQSLRIRRSPYFQQATRVPQNISRDPTELGFMSQGYLIISIIITLFSHMQRKI